MIDGVIHRQSIIDLPSPAAFTQIPITASTAAPPSAFYLSPIQVIPNHVMHHQQQPSRRSHHHHHHRHVDDRIGTSSTRGQ